MGEHSLLQLAKKHNMPYGRLQTRVYRGSTIKEALAIENMTVIESTTPFIHNKSSGVRGVTWCERTQSWQGQFQYLNKTYYCGRHSIIAEAAEAVRKRKIELGANL